MKLSGIQPLMLQAEQKMNSIQSRIKKYLGIVIGYRTFVVSQINPWNIELFERSDIFEPGQAILPETEKLYLSYKIIEEALNKEKPPDQIRNKAKKAEALKKRLDMAEIKEKLVTILGQIEFKTPQFELRFRELDMDAIQEIKSHAMVQEVGKTSMSRASIRVVIL